MVVDGEGYLYFKGLANGASHDALGKSGDISAVFGEQNIGSGGFSVCKGFSVDGNVGEQDTSSTIPDRSS